MLMDYSPLKDGIMTLPAFAAQFTPDDLRAATLTSIETMLDLIRAASDAEIAFIPDDPDADDPMPSPVRSASAGAWGIWWRT